MAAVELSLEQILEAVRQLPKAERIALLRAAAATPSAERTKTNAARIRPAHRLTRTRRERLSFLLRKGNSGTLTSQESMELDALVEQFEEKTLHMARELARPRRPLHRSKIGR